MIAIIDYGMGNLGSVKKSIDRLGYESVVTNDKSMLSKCDKLILPGVGHFAAGMKKLSALGLVSLLEKMVFNDQIPILGICLGMQLLSNSSEEGNVNGLGWIAGRVRKFNNFNAPSLKIPHMGWSTIKKCRDHLLLKDIEDGAEFYFVHSYFFDAEYPESIVSTTNYIQDFACIVSKGNILGVQFHPEKSHDTGYKLLKSFAEL